MVRVCKSNRIFPSLSVRLSITLSPKPMGEFNQIYYIIYLLVRVCDSNIIFLSVRPPSFCPSSYLLRNLRAEFNQTCYITSRHGKGVREQPYFYVLPSMRPAAIHLSIKLSPLKPLGGIQPNLLHHFPSW